MSNEVNKEETVNDAIEPEFVPKKAYKEVTDDMFKYKNKLKETEALLNQLAAEKEAAELQSLKDNEQWKTLYEKNQSQLEELSRTRSQERDQFVNYHKKSAVLKELGGFKKDEYTNFINTAAVELDEQGNVINESLVAEVNRIKQTYPELIKSAPANNLPNNAPRGIIVADKPYAQMTEKEKNEYKMSLIKKPQ